MEWGAVLGDGTCWSVFWEDACQLCVGWALGRKVKVGLRRLETDDKDLSLESDNMQSRRRIWDLLSREDFLRFGERKEMTTKDSSLIERIVWDQQWIGGLGEWLGQGGDGFCLGMLNMRAVWPWHWAPHSSPHSSFQRWATLLHWYLEIFF